MIKHQGEQTKKNDHSFANDKRLQILKKKWHEETLAHFYIIKTTRHSGPAEKFGSHRYLRQWPNEFLSYVGTQEQKAYTPTTQKSPQQMNCPDWLFIEKDKKSAFYSQQELNEFFTFMAHPPFAHKYKFVVVNDAHLLGPGPSHKMLKTLEEPQQRTVIFFLVAGDIALLPTIESRAVQLILPRPPSGGIDKDLPLSSQNPWRPYFAKKVLKQTTDLSPKIKSLLAQVIYKQATVSVLIQAIKSSTVEQTKILHLCFEIMLAKNTHFTQLQQFQSDYKWYQESMLYGNPPSQRLFNLLTTAMA